VTGTPSPGLGSRIRSRLRALLAERLTPAEAAAAVFVGITLGIVPIYGAQSIVALALATLLRLNRPLTLAATFINNPLLQPFLVLGGIEVGHRVLHGRWAALAVSELTSGGLRGQLPVFIVGSLVLALVLAVPLAALTYIATAWRTRRSAADAGRPAARLRAEARARFAGLPLNDRAFVWWKLRLDRVFDVLLAEDLGTGPVVDLGCGYGLALLASEIKSPGRALAGCDLDARRVTAARHALGPGSRIEVHDAAAFELPPSSLVLIIDVLQYFDRPGQQRLLTRCFQALEPGGRLVFRVPETRQGLTTTLTRLLDRAVFGIGGAKERPVHLQAVEYRRWLEDLGFSTVTEQHRRNLLPLSHVIFVASKAREAVGA
jgi:uncharacterized protein (DUF2062 family)